MSRDNSSKRKLATVTPIVAAAASALSVEIARNVPAQDQELAHFAAPSCAAALSSTSTTSMSLMEMETEVRQFVLLSASNPGEALAATRSPVPGQ